MEFSVASNNISLFKYVIYLKKVLLMKVYGKDVNLDLNSHRAKRKCFEDKNLQNTPMNTIMPR